MILRVKIRLFFFLFLLLIFISRITGLSSRKPTASPQKSNQRFQTQFISGRRCLILPPSSQSVKGNPPHPPPLVIIGGTAQSINSWEHHFTGLRRNRHVLIYECLGQGPLPQHAENTEDYFCDVSLQTQAADLASILLSPTVVTSTSSSVSSSSPVTYDLAGFSFGGRVALSLAVTHPHLVRRVHVTGVPAERDAFGRHVLTSWRDILSSCRDDNDDATTTTTTTTTSRASMRAFAWSCLFHTYSPTFLSRQDDGRLRLWVERICEGNNPRGLLALLEQTHTDDLEDEWHVLSMARKIVEEQGSLYDTTGVNDEGDCGIRGRLVVGELDCMASVAEVRRLSRVLGWGEVGVFEGSGHAAVIERAREWRKDLLDFLDS